MGKNRGKMIGFWVDLETKKALKRLAEAEDRTLSQYMARLVRKHLEEKAKEKP